MSKKCIFIILAVFMISILTIVMVASSIQFRFANTHSIVKQSVCYGCHMEETNDSKYGLHIANVIHKRPFSDYIDIYGNISEQEMTFDGICYSCHVTYKSFDRFALTDPYVYNSSYRDGNGNGTDGQYGYIIKWPYSVSEHYNNISDAGITVELELLSINNSNSTLDSTIKVILNNYSGQQTGNTSYDHYQMLSMGDTQVMKVSNIVNDYFSMILILDGVWSNATLNLRIRGTDKGDENYTISVDSPPVIYTAPIDIGGGKKFFKTNGTYKSVKLSSIFSEWKNYDMMNNITSSEDIKTNSTNGWITSNTCSAPSAMCHITQKTTYMGMTDNSGKSLYTHDMEYVAMNNCRLCHLKNSIIRR